MTFEELIEQILDVQGAGRFGQRVLGSFGLRLAACDEEEKKWADYLYSTQEQYLNIYEGIHGGIACTLADSCMGMTVCAATGTLPSTTDISVSFLRPMTAPEYRIHVEIKKPGKQLAAAVCEITDAGTGALCITAMGKFILVRKNLVSDEHVETVMKQTLKDIDYDKAN